MYRGRNDRMILNRLGLIQLIDN